MKLVHKSLTPWISFVCLLMMAVSGSVSSQQAEPLYTSFYNPNKGFKAAQTSLADIFLQLAGSMEHHGSPEPYLRHVLGEDGRIAKKYLATNDKEMASVLANYMTEEYIQKLAENWNKLSPRLKLDELARNMGRAIRLSLNGQNGETSLILLLNHHQNIMVQNDGLKSLCEDLVKVRNQGEATVMAEQETALSQSEQNLFKTFLEKPRFKKSDFQTLESFYRDGGPHDRLSENGKKLMSVRTWAGTKSASIPTKDAQQNLQVAWGLLDELYNKLEKAGTPIESLTEFKTWMTAVAENIGRAAQAEIRLAAIEQSVQK